MKFYSLLDKYLLEAEANIEKLAQQDPREIYSDEEVKEMPEDSSLARETGPDEAFKSLEDTLDKFYALGQKGLGADADMVMERIAEILRLHEVDQSNMKQFTDVLGSILLGQSVRGYANSRD